MDLECFSCFIKSLLSALWLVDDSAAVSLRYVLTRDGMTTFVPSVVLRAAFLAISWLIHVHSWTSAHLKPWTAQGVIAPCSSHTCLTDSNLLYCGKSSEVVPSFPLPMPLGRSGTCAVPGYDGRTRQLPPPIRPITSRMNSRRTVLTYLAAEHRML